MSKHIRCLLCPFKRYLFDYGTLYFPHRNVGAYKMIVPLPYLLARAQTGGYALGYFEAWDSYSLEAVIEAAEAEDAPVILGFGCMMVSQTWLDTGGIETLSSLGHALAQRTHVPVA